MLAVKLLGQFEVRLDGIAIDIPSRTAQSLLAYLISNPGTSFRREQLAGVLWPDSTEANSKGYLRNAIWRIRKTLKDISSDSSEYILSNKISLAFNDRLPFWVDTQVLEKSKGRSAQELLVETSLYQGELLPGFYEDWVVLERERLRTIFDRRMHRLLQCLTDEGSWEQVIEGAERWISLGDTPEPAYRAMMLAYASLGDKSKALAIFKRCAEALEYELGASPTDETIRLEKRIRSGEPLFTPADQKGVRGYDLRELLGQGSYGSVFNAFHSATGREVAVKVIRPEYANDPDFIRRFEVEAQSVARLEHPFIVPLYDFWREPDGAFLVTRLLKGGSLQTALQSSPLELGQVAAMLDQLAAGLQTAHQHGLIHQRLKPSDILFDEAGHAYLYDLGMASILGGNGHKPPASIYTAPELRNNKPPTPQADLYSLGVILFQALSGSLPETHPEGGIALSLLRSHRPELPVEIERVLQRATAADPALRYPDALSLAADFSQAAGGASRATRSTDEKTALTGIDNPYKGLAAFDEADAPFFFGREALVERLLNRLGDDHKYARFLAVVGPSGSGKSSLVKAGLVPALRSGALPGSKEWFIVPMTPGTHPLEELEINLTRISSNPSLSLMEHLRRDERGLLRAVRLALPGDDCQLLLVIDQFEETFTLAEDKAEAKRFLDGLYIAATATRSPVRVIITLRADFYDRPLMHPDFSRLVQERTEVVVPLTLKELESAIASPAGLVGVSLDPALITAMVVDVIEQPDALPLLQYALTELFEQRKKDFLTLEDYQAMGGVEGVLERSAEAVFERLEDTGQEMAHQLFLRLVTLGEGVEDTRRRALRAELEALEFSQLNRMAASSENSASPLGDIPLSMGRVIDLFGNARLVSFSLDPLTRTPTVDITHEALLREWPRLRLWLEEGRADVRTQRALAGAAVEWEKADRDPSFLLHGVRLSQFESWVSETDLALTGEERLFLKASLDQRALQQRAEEERKARLAALERRSRVFLRTLVVVLLLASLASLTLAGFARRAQAQATSRELTAVAINTLEEDPELSILLSLEALRIADTREAEEALHRSLRSSRLRLSFEGHRDGVASVHFSRDGRLIASASLREKNEVIIWEAASGQVLARRPGRVARFSPDGGLLATGSEDSRVYLWDTTTWEAVHMLSGHSAGVQDIHFNPQGTLLASASLDETFSVWESGSGRQVFSGPAAVHGYDSLDNLAFSPDGKLLFAVEYHGGEINIENAGTMRVYGVDQGWALLNEYPSADLIFNISPNSRWMASFGEEQLRAILLRDISGMPGGDLAAGSISKIEPLVTHAAHQSVILKFSFNPDGSLLATASLDGEAKIWNLTSQGAELLMTLAGHKDIINDVAFSPDGKQVGTASLDGTVKVWDITLAGISEGFTLEAHQNNINHFGFTTDGSLLASASRDGTARVWDPKSGDLLVTVADSGSPLMGVAISPDGKYLATGGDDNKARIYKLEIESGEARTELLHVLTGHIQADPIGGLFPGLTAVTFSPDGRKLATGGVDGFAKVWQVESGQELLSVQGHPMGLGITNLAFSPDNRYLATTSDQGIDFEAGALAKIWDAASGEELVTFEGHIHSDRIWGLAFSPDGERLATSGSLAKLWERSSGLEIAELSGHTSIAGGLSFSPDGKYLASASLDGTARLWDASTGVFLQSFSGPGGPLYMAGFSPDGKYLVASGSGIIYGFILDQEDLVDLAHSRLTRWFTPDECVQYLHQETCPSPPLGTGLAAQVP